MPLAALLIADDEAHQPGLTAAPLLFGQTVPEFQARLAHAAGAGHIIMLASRLPADLIAGLDRLRAEGINVETVRTARDAADHIHPDETVLLLAGPIVPDIADLRILIDSAAPCLWTRAAGENDVSMRIDAADDWAGVALIHGHMLRETCEELGDWELAPTLLRRSVQAGVARARPDAEGLEPLATPAMALVRAKGLLKTPILIKSASISDAPLAAFARAATPGLLRMPISFRLVDGFALAAAAAGFLAAAAGWTLSGLSLLLCGALSAAVATRVARLPLGPFRALELYRHSAPWLGAASLLATGWHSSMGAGTLTAVILSLWAASLTRPLRARHPAYSDVTSMMVLVLLSSIAGFVMIGFALCVTHGLVSRLHAELKSKTPSLA